MRAGLAGVLFSGCVAAAQVGETRIEHGRHVAANGLEGEFLLFGDAAESSAGALVFLHADDGADTFDEWVGPEVRALAARQGLFLVSLREPDGGCWWAPRGEDDTAFLVDFLRFRVVGAWGADPRRIFLAGKSGGGFFASGVPALSGFAFGGAVIGLCGGDVPRRNGGDCATESDAPEADVPVVGADPEAVAYWFAGTRGDAWFSYAVDAAVRLRDAGAPVVLRDVGPGGHCEFDVVGELGRALDVVAR